jgi:hypothetical protein
MTKIPLASEVDPSAATPVKSASWPKMMLAATPVRNPIITEWETNRVNLPSLSTPAITIRAPAMITRRKSEPGRSAPSTALRADPAASAAAVVVVITIDPVLEDRPPAMGPAKLA